MTKIDIISGFLGAGKTTLIKKILEERKKGQVIAIIENEFGDIGIDGDILQEQGIAVEEIYSGCICCTLLGNFERALLELILKYNPDRIIIEPTGIAKLSDVERACISAQERDDVQPGMRLVVVNATNFDRYMNGWPEFFIDQIEHAKTVVFSRSQLADAETMETVAARIRRINPTAKQITTPWETISAETIIRVAERDVALSLEHELQHHHGEACTCGHHHEDGKHHSEHEHNHDEHTHTADEAFDMWGIETPKVFAKENLEHVLHELGGSQYGTILRAKGIVQLEGQQWTQFDFVPGEVNLAGRAPDYTGRICV
ncbi:MAG: GTP-binding protein, partial [Eubacteriales bacterium]